MIHFIDQAVVECIFETKQNSTKEIRKQTGNKELFSNH